MMGRRKLSRSWLAGVAACAVLALACAHAQAPQREVKRDVPYVPTPQVVVDEMLKMANVGKDDVVYDLSCGDWWLVFTYVMNHVARRWVGG